MTQDEWIQLGVDKGWCTPSVCDTHDGIPLTEPERLDWEEGFVPCVHVLRLLTPDDIIEYL